MLPTDYLVWALLTMAGFVVVAGAVYLGLRAIADTVADGIVALINEQAVTHSRQISAATFGCDHCDVTSTDIDWLLTHERQHHG